MISSLYGSYPRTPLGSGPFRLKKAIEDAQSGLLSQADLERIEDAVVREVMGELEEVGVELLTDGLIRWEDGQTRLTRLLDGFESTGLIRYFDTNTYYRQPVVKGPVLWKLPILLEEFQFARQATQRPLKAVVTGPYTLAALSRDDFYKDRAKLVGALAEALRCEILSLVRAGAPVVGIDEPAITRNPKEFPIFAAGIRSLTRGVEALTVLQLSFGDASPILEDLLGLPVDVIGLDFVAAPRQAKALSGLRWTKGLYAGLVDARNTMLEKESDLVRRIQELARRIDGQRLQIGPSCGLEFLPRETAREKMRVLARAVDRARGRRR